jgi:hypothetical protein
MLFTEQKLLCKEHFLLSNGMNEVKKVLFKVLFDHLLVFFVLVESMKDQ